MAQTLSNSQRQQQHAFTPSLITNRLHNICKHLTLGRQEDAHEFLRYLIEQMEKSFLNRFKAQPWFKELDQYSKETTPLNQILGGYLRSTVTCLSCKHESITFQHFGDMPLDISRVSSLSEAISGYFARENLEECGYKCESCKKKVSATKRFSLERAPVVLCIQLKRFNVMGGKLSKQIQISQNLDLQKHLAKAGDPNQSCYYKLVSMVTHLGSSASGGHYTAIGLAPNGNYYQFDDSCVTSISTENMLRTNPYVLFYELVRPAKQNGHNNGFNGSHMSEHTYSRTPSATSTSVSSAAPRNDFDRLRETFAKPTLPKMLPASIMKQNSHLKQKENETTPPSSRMTPSTSKGPNFNGKVATQLFPAVKTNGKRDASDDEGEREEGPTKKMKPNLPSLPRLSSDESDSTPKMPLTPSTSSSTSSPATPQKPRSLVPYETDDEDEEPSSILNGSLKKSDLDSVKFCRTSSGVFLEMDVKVNSPSKQGSTVDKTVVTKASLTNGSTTNGHLNGKITTNVQINGKITTNVQVNGKIATNGNGYHVKRNDDAIQQLAKLNHSGYGTSEVVSWNNTPTSMNREVDKDQLDERQRQMEDEEDLEMDAGRTKKIKNGNRYHGPNTHYAKLPNPFQEQQNMSNQNASFRGQQSSYNYNDRANNNSNNGFHRNQAPYQNSNRQNGGGGGKYKGNFKRDNFGHQNGYRYNNNGGGKFNPKRNYDNNRR